MEARIMKIDHWGASQVVKFHNVQGFRCWDVADDKQRRARVIAFQMRTWYFDREISGLPELQDGISS
jgi:hypothetical protein